MSVFAPERNVTFAPTAEQEVAVGYFATGEDLAIEAGAGAGKTSTLLLLAASRPDQRGQYVAFNRGIVQEASTKFPETVSCNTAHSLAFKAVGRDFAERLRSNNNRLTSFQLARRLGLRDTRLGAKVVDAGMLAGMASKMVVKFCQSADAEITERHHAYVDGLDPIEDGQRSYEQNNRLARLLLPAARQIWADAINPQGTLPYKHDFYLKLWERSNPVIDAAYVMVDEAQDLSPVIASIVAQQTCQKVYVGDSNQQIYEFTGAINALANVTVTNRCFLTQSFRFGPAIADQANRVLANLPTEMRIEGAGNPASMVAPVEQPDVVLTRTNAIAVSTFMAFLSQGVTAHIVGGGAEIVQFAKASMELRENGRTRHPDLACFTSWAEVVAYVEDDPQGEELALLVKIIDDFGAEVLIEALEQMTSARRADVTISTAHKSKGLEWDTVRLAEDFRTPTAERPLPPSEWRLLYVAVTRAKLTLDITRVPALAG